MPTATELKKEFEQHKENRKNYKLEGDDKVAHEFYIDRRKVLKEYRENLGGGKDGFELEELWEAADKAYVPHRLKHEKGKKVFASDDELGWRSTPIRLGKSDEWQEDSVPTNPYVKIQTALGILIDRNPRAVFKAISKQYGGSTELLQELYKQNWDTARSKEMLKTLVFNGAKYGIFTLITKHLKLQRNVRNLVNFDPKDPKNNKYEDEIVTIYDDVYRWAYDPWDVWIDDNYKPGDRFSLNDFTYKKDMEWGEFKEQFKGFKNYKFVVPNTKPQEEKNDTEDEDRTNNMMVRLWYYENLQRDHYFVETNDGVVLINEPIPMEGGNKRLSLSTAPWTIRNQKTGYGIGVYEAMRNDYKLYLKVRNMTIDQLVLSIYKEWFYEGTNTLQNTGEMTIRPGMGRQVTNPKNIVWNEVPGPGQEAWEALDWIGNRIDDATGITKTLEGELSPDAKAFDIAQARESALRRMKTPLDNLASVLEQDAYVTVGLFEEIYSVPEIEQVTDEEEILKLREEIAQGSLRSQDVRETIDIDENTGEPITQMEVKRFRSFPLNLDRDDNGNITQVKEEKFFTVRPEDLRWEGQISITGQSIVPESPLLEKQNKLDFANMLVPLFAQPPELVLNAAKQLAKAFDEDPDEWFPEAWNQILENGFPQEEQGLFVPRGQQQGSAPTQQTPQAQQPTQQLEAETVVPSTDRGNNQSVVGRLVNRITGAFNKNE